MAPRSMSLGSGTLAAGGSLTLLTVPPDTTILVKHFLWWSSTAADPGFQISMGTPPGSSVYVAWWPVVANEHGTFECWLVLEPGMWLRITNRTTSLLSYAVSGTYLAGVAPQLFATQLPDYGEPEES
jgi:hypothetical protein